MLGVANFERLFVGIEKPSDFVALDEHKLPLLACFKPFVQVRFVDGKLFL